MNDWSALRVSTLTALPALALILAAWAAAHALGQVRIDASALPAASWRLAYVSLAGVVIAMFLWNAACSASDRERDAVLNLMPVVTFAFRAAEGARFETIELVGAAVVVGRWWRTTCCCGGARGGIGRGQARAAQDTGLRVRRPSNREKIPVRRHPLAARFDRHRGEVGIQGPGCRAPRAPGTRPGRSPSGADPADRHGVWLVAQLPREGQRVRQRLGLEKTFG